MTKIILSIKSVICQDLMISILFKNIFFYLKKFNRKIIGRLD